MKPNAPILLLFYSLTIGISVASGIFAYLTFLASAIGFLLFTAISYASLNASRNAAEDNNPYLNISEKIATVGIVVFLPLIFLTNILIALISLLCFATLALNFQIYDFRRLYVGLTTTFIGMCVGAAETKSGGYLFYFLVYTTFASITLGYAYIGQRCELKNQHWSLQNRFNIIGGMVLLSTVIYLLLPRLPAGNLGGHAGSDHFYRNNQWEKQANENANLKDGSLDEELNRLNKNNTKNAPSLDDQQNIINKQASEQQVTENNPNNNGTKNDSNFHYEGFEQEFDIRNPDPKNHRFSNNIVAYMRASRPLYLRTHIFDLFDGLHWSTTQTPGLKLKVDQHGLLFRTIPQQTATETYEMQIEATIGDAIPLAAVPVKLQFPSTAINLDKFGLATAPGTLRKGTGYTAEALIHSQAGRIFSELSFNPKTEYTQLPDAIDSRISELSSSIIKDTHTQFEAAIALESYLRNNYTYQLESVFTSQGSTPLAEFLFEKKQGHCEYFASALAIMLRTQGIAARLVTGFSATQQNPLTGFYEIHALDGHAWVEAYVDNIGWMLLEPTAFYDGPMPNAEPLSAKLIDHYVKRQEKNREALKSTTFSWEGVFISLWQTIALNSIVALAHIKLFILQVWMEFLFVGLLGGITYYFWLYIQPEWQAKKIYRDALAQAKNTPANSMEIYLRAIDKIIRLTGEKYPAGETIEQYLDRTARFFSTQFEERMSSDFNRVHYGLSSENISGVDYLQLLNSIHKLGYRNLAVKIRAKST